MQNDVTGRLILDAKPRITARPPPPSPRPAPLPVSSQPFGFAVLAFFESPFYNSGSQVSKTYRLF